MTETGELAEPEATVRYVIPEGSGFKKYLWLLPFLLPAAYTVITLKQQRTLLKELGYYVVIAPVIFQIWAHQYTGSLLLGGFLALVSIGGILVVTTCNSYQMLNKQFKRDAASGAP